MSIQDDLKKGFRHPSKQPGWTDASYKPSKTLEEANYLGDEEYHNSLGVHNPLWRYIIKRYTVESDAPLLVMGSQSLPLAIELSQWTYPVNLIVRDGKEKRQAESDAKRQAGFFKSIRVDGEGYPKSRIAIFIGIIDDLPDNRAKEFVDFLLKGVKEVVCAVRPTRNWRDIFGKRIIDALGYNKGRWLLLRLN